jgi:hypothetical protein
MPAIAASPAGSTATAGGAGAVAPPAKTKLKKKSDSLPGEKLGFPMYHAISGNLPVLSAQFWTSPVCNLVSRLALDTAVHSPASIVPARGMFMTPPVG